MSSVNQSKKPKKIEIKIPEDNIKRKSAKFKILTIFILLIASSVLAYFNIDLNIKLKDASETDTVEIVIENASKIELSENQEIETILETESGDVEVLAMPVIESVDGGEIDEEFDPDRDGQGANYNIDTPQAFADDTLGECITMGNKYGAQCVSLARAYWESYTPRSFSTCGTGMAKGSWECRDYNAGTEFDLIYDKDKIQAGDWIVFDGGKYGHIGMALGEPNKGYVALLGENQGGTSCAGGGSATNIINMSLKNFIGAYRPKIYETPKAPDTGFVPKDMI